MRFWRWYRSWDGHLSNWVRHVDWCGLQVGARWTIKARKGIGGYNVWTGWGLLDTLLDDQRDLTAVEHFARRHNDGSLPAQAKYYRDLIPATPPGPGQQYAFDVDLDACEGERPRRTLEEPRRGAVGEEKKKSESVGKRYMVCSHPPLPHRYPPFDSTV